MKRKWDVGDEQTRKKCVEEVITRIEEQDGEAFGIIAAEDIITIVLQNLGPAVYNMALEDARKTIHDKLADIEVDLDLLRSS